MDNPVIELLCKRVSSPRLVEPAPTKPELEKVFQSALRAPDHMMLRPWRYLVIEGDSREKLGQLFLTASESVARENNETLDEFKIEKLKSMPHRAPTIVVALASIKQHPKVPELEQFLSCGVGVGYMLVALQALGYGGIWRTGDLAFNAEVGKGLGLKETETIIGFLYLGTPAGELKSVPELNIDDFVETWS